MPWHEVKTRTEGAFHQQWYLKRGSYLTVSVPRGFRRLTGSANIPLGQWQMGRGRQKHPARVHRTRTGTGFAKADLTPPVVASHRSTALSDSKEQKFLPGEQLRHCLVIFCKNLAGCTHVAGIHLHVISDKIFYWFIEVRIRLAGMG